MTGPERETLSQALELQRAVLTSLDAFRAEIGRDLREFREEIKNVVDGLDNRLSEVEHAELSRLSEAAGVAKFTAQQEVAKEKRGISTARLITILAGTAGIVTAIVNIIFQTLHL